MAESSLFTNLKRLFSTDVVIRSVGGGNLKLIDINKVQTTGKYETNSLVDRFTKLYTYNNVNNFNPNVNYQTLRNQLYSDYEAMDTDSIIASTLDIIADEATVKNDVGDILSIKTSDEKIQNTLYNLFYDILNIEFNLWSWIRTMCKHGDFFLKLEIAEELGVYNVIPYTVYNVTREEGIDPEKPFEVTFIYNPNGVLNTQQQGSLPYRKANDSRIEFKNYEVAHFRLISDVSYLPYGRSYLEPARKIYKQVMLMEDAMLIHRIMRAPEKRVFFINVGQIPPNEVEQYMKKTMDNMKKTPYVGEDGQYNLKFNLQNMMEDFYIPVRGGDSTTKIDTTKGMDYDGVEDIKYLQAKMFAALKVPKAYFGYEGELQGKATLAAEDIRFARTVERIQRIIESELTKIALVHLYSQGIKGESLTNFELKLTTPSIIFEQEKVALFKEKADLAEQLLSSRLFSTDYVYENLFNLSEDEYTEMKEIIKEDYKHWFRLSQIENEGNDPVTSGKSYGTPHDLASMYGRRASNSDRDSQFYNEIPEEYLDHPKPPKHGEPGPKGGRPLEKHSIYGKQEDPLGGRDRLGKKDMRKPYQDTEDKMMETRDTRVEFEKMKDSLKKIVFSKEKKEEAKLLRESNIKDLDS